MFAAATCTGARASLSLPQRIVSARKLHVSSAIKSCASYVIRDVSSGALRINQVSAAVRHFQLVSAAAHDCAVD